MGRGILGSNPIGLTILKSIESLSGNTNSSLWICIYKIIVVILQYQNKDNV